MSWLRCQPLVSIINRYEAFRFYQFTLNIIGSKILNAVSFVKYHLVQPINRIRSYRKVSYLHRYITKFYKKV